MASQSIKMPKMPKMRVPCMICKKAFFDLESHTRLKHTQLTLSITVDWDKLLKASGFTLGLAQLNANGVVSNYWGLVTIRGKERVMFTSENDKGSYTIYLSQDGELDVFRIGSQGHPTKENKSLVNASVNGKPLAYNPS